MSDQAIRVLLIEDNPADARLMAEMLAGAGKSRFELECVGRLSEGLERLAQGGIDVVLLDLGLPDSVGLDTLGTVLSRAPETPIVVLTVVDDEQLAVQAVREGAEDYLVKGRVDGDLLVRSISYAIERKRADQQLIRERQFSNGIVEAAAALIVVLDPEGRILRFNAACERSTGYSFDEVKGRLIWDALVAPEERAAVAKVFAALPADTGYSTHEGHWLTKDGGRRLVSWATTCVLDEKGDVRWVIGSGLDVTEQRKLEEQLQRAAKLEAVGQLAGGMAHDFNNLLTAILGYVDLNLPDIPTGTQLHEDLSQVRVSAKRASELTRQLLMFGRQQVVEPEVLDLNATVGDVCEMLKHLIEETIEIQVVLSDRPLRVKADPAQVGQVLMNLAVNARDAMPDGGPLTIETTVVELGRDEATTRPGMEPGWHARLSVTDTGVGMSREVRDRIFDPFFTTKDVGQGTGLGLSTVYGIVQQHNGHITCYSEPGAGTTFRVYLPLVAAEQVASPESTAFGLRFGGSETILLVEDEDEVRRLTARALTELGYNVLSASDGVKALDLLRRHQGRLDLLITDVVMPKMDGRELAHRVRSMHPDVKLLFMSGYLGDGTQVSGVELPGVPVLQKPFSANKLAKWVREVLDAV